MNITIKTLILLFLLSPSAECFGGLKARRVSDALSELRATRRILSSNDKSNRVGGRDHWVVATRKGEVSTITPDRVTLIRASDSGGRYQEFDINVDNDNYHNYGGMTYSHFESRVDAVPNFSIVNKVKNRREEIQTDFTVERVGEDYKRLTNQVNYRHTQVANHLAETRPEVLIKVQSTSGDISGRRAIHITAGKGAFGVTKGVTLPENIKGFITHVEVEAESPTLTGSGNRGPTNLSVEIWTSEGEMLVVPIEVPQYRYGERRATLEFGNVSRRAISPGDLSKIDVEFHDYGVATTPIETEGLIITDIPVEP